jgi:LPS-assembly protein
MMAHLSYINKWFHFGVLFLSGIILSYLSQPVQAAETLSSPWQITADRIENFKEPERIIAEGNVILNRLAGSEDDTMVIKADWVEYEVEQGAIAARGNIIISSRGDEIKADEARINLNKQTGTLLETSLFFKDNEMYFTGKRVEKTGEQTYHLENGWISSCKKTEGKSVPWAITSASARVTLEGYAVLKHAIFRVKDFPVLYAPYLIFPAKLTRQTGFLFPEISNSNRDGFGFISPFFINLSPSADITLYPGYLDKKGVHSAFEFRYVAGLESRGMLMANYLYDRTTDTIDDDFSSDGDFRNIHDRYWFRGKIDHDFGNNVVARLDADVVSDKDYLQEYRDGIIGFRKTNEEFVDDFNRGLVAESIDFRESTIQLGKSGTGVYMGGELRAVDDVSDAGSTPTEIQTLPRLLVNARMPMDSIPVSFAWDNEYIHYWSEEGVGEQRFDTHPRLIAPLPLGRYVEGKIVGGLRQTAYQVDLFGDATHSWLYGFSRSRTAWDVSANAATILTRDFGMLDAITPKFSHIFRPNIEYKYVDATELLALIDFDGDDKVISENGLTYDLTNYFMIGQAQADGRTATRNFGRLKVSQTYNLTEARRQLTSATDKRSPFSDIFFELAVYPTTRMEVRYDTNLNVYGKGTSSYNLVTRYSDTRGDSLSVDYRYVINSIHQLNFTAELALTDHFSVKGSTTQSLLTDEVVESTAGFIYKPPCWAMELQYSETGDDKKMMMVFMLEGVGKAFELGKSNM